jgi:hypothetical protein
MSDELTKIMQAQIVQRIRNRMEAQRLTAVVVRQVKGNRAEQEKNIELYLDQWAFEHGAITKANIEQALADCMDFALRVMERKQQNDWDTTRNSDLEF